MSKLTTPALTEAPGQEARKEREEEAERDSSSILLRFNNWKVRSLVDSGADVSLINHELVSTVDDIELWPSTETKLQGITGTPLRVHGKAELQIHVGKKPIKHMFYVVDNISPSILLGRDFLIQHKVKLDFDKGQFHLQGQVVPLESDSYLASLVRLTSRKVLKPQTVVMCWGRFRNQKHIHPPTLCTVTGIDTGFMNREPGLMVTNSVTRVRKNKAIPILICNNTNRTFTLEKGNVVARVEKVSGTINSLKEMRTKANQTQQQKANKRVEDEMIDAPKEHCDTLKGLLDEFEDIFAKTDLELGKTDAVSMKIDTGDVPPIRLKPYRTALHNREIIDKAIDDMLAAKIIEPSHSQWSFPVVVVDKKDGSKRFCVDFRKLNKITKAFYWPLPHLDDILSSLGKSKFFTSLDMKSGYWQVPMASPEDKEKTAFTCFRGLFHFNVMPFGLVSAPSVFQELMTYVLQGLSFAHAYLDDIIVHSEDVTTHIKHLREVFTRLRQYDLRLKFL